MTRSAFPAPVTVAAAGGATASGAASPATAAAAATRCQALERPSNPHNKVQAGLVSWGADFPTASDYFLPVLTCHSGFNAGQYCNHHIDTLASRAQAEQLTNPAAARALWGQIDRLVTDRAPWVPIFNQAPTVFVTSRVGNYQDPPTVLCSIKSGSGSRPWHADHSIPSWPGKGA